MDPQCREGSIPSEDSRVDPFEISDIHTYPKRHHWSFAFAHASASSKCILFAIRNLFQLNPFLSYFGARTAEWIVGEMIDWLKVGDSALITEIFCSPDNWEEPNSGSSPTGSVDCLDGRCTQENWRGNRDSEADGYWWRAAAICRVSKHDPNYVIWAGGRYLFTKYMDFMHRKSTTLSCRDTLHSVHSSF